MRVIEHGELPENKVFTHRCTKCKTLYEFVAKEGTYQHDPRDGDFIITFCPVCSRQNFTGVK